jgi:hypothetical protein
LAWHAPLFPVRDTFSFLLFIARRRARATAFLIAKFRDQNLAYLYANKRQLLSLIATKLEIATLASPRYFLALFTPH